MKLHELIVDTYSPSEAEQVQNRWRDQLASSLYSNCIDLDSVHYIAGVDIAYTPGLNRTWGMASAVLWDFIKHIEIAHVSISGEIKFPYIPGLLGFREGKLLVQAIEQLPQRPELIMTDGHGWLHPRRMGEAVHVGVAMGIACIGIAKKMLYGEGNWHYVQLIKGSRIELFKPGTKIEERDENSLLGYCICLCTQYKPVFVSPGYFIRPNIACDIALQSTVNHRQPNPLILAHIYANMAIHQKSKPIRAKFI
jgi:deoxyribonuclease V